MSVFYVQSNFVNWDPKILVCTAVKGSFYLSMMILKIQNIFCTHTSKALVEVDKIFLDHEQNCKSSSLSSVFVSTFQEKPISCFFLLQMPDIWQTFENMKLSDNLD